MLARHIKNHDAGQVIEALLSAGTITPAEADTLRNGGTMLLAIGGVEGVEASLAAAAKSAGKRGRPPAVSEESLRRAEELVRTGAASLRAAATETGIARSTLSDHMALGGRPGRQRSLGPSEVAKARRLLGEPGFTVAQVAASLGVSEPTLRRALRRAG